MKKQGQSPFQKLVDPFSIPTQLNNLGVLIVAYVTVSMKESTGCSDPQNESFLHFIYYGSIIVCGGTFLLSILYFFGIIDYCLTTVLPCGEVCLTLNTLTIFLIGLLYHCVATVYGLKEMISSRASKCIELQMFKRIACTIYSLWFFAFVAYLLLYYCYFKKKRALQANFVQM